MDIESKLQAKIRTYFKKNGYFVTKLIRTSTNGIPDLMAIKNGKTIFVEIKRQGKRAEPLQLYMMEELNKYGCYCFECDNYELFLDKMNLFQSLTNR